MTASHNVSGVTLVELMVALTIASVTMLGTIRLYSHAATMFRSAQAEQSLEETAQLAIAALRTDIEQAGFFGLLAPEDPLASGQQRPSIAVRGDCGADWSIRLREPVAGSDNSYAWACGAWSDAAVAGADTLVLRYVDPVAPEALERGRIYLRSSASEPAALFIAPHGPGLSDDPLDRTHLLRARGYYVSASSAADTADNEVPALRVKHLTRRSTRPAIIDEEIQSGVADLQVEYLTDTNQFVDASALTEDDEIRAVRVWLLIRSSFAETNASTSIPAYASRSARAYSDGYRRRLFHFTIAVGHGSML